MRDAPLIPPTMLHHFELPCPATTAKWKNSSGIDLGPEHALPDLGQLDGRPAGAIVQAAWSADGLFFVVTVSGKKQSLWCRETQLTESDGVHLFIDTRNTQSIHRASRFCHWFLFLPAGGGTGRSGPVNMMLKINRAKEDPKTLNRVKTRCHACITPDGYRLAAFIPGTALTGWDPEQHTRLGFHYTIVDRELGQQTLTATPEFPVDEDPSLWQTLALGPPADHPAP